MWLTSCPTKRETPPKKLRLYIYFIFGCGANSGGHVQGISTPIWSTALYRFRGHSSKVRACVNAENTIAAGCYGMGDLFEMKGTLGPGCHLLHGPGSPLDELRGTRLVHHRFRMHWQTDSLILGARGPSNRSFIPTYSHRSPNRRRGLSYGGTRASTRISFLRGRNEGAQGAMCERLRPRFPNDSPKVRSKSRGKSDEFGAKGIDRSSFYSFNVRLAGADDPLRLSDVQPIVDEKSPTRVEM